MRMSTVLMWAVAVSAVIGGMDKIFGNRLGLGDRFDEGFRLMGPLISGMLGILCLTPVFSNILEISIAPLYARIGFDPSVLAGIIPIDMGGYQLAAGLAADPEIMKFSAVILTAVFGCTMVFTIPVGFGMMAETNRKPFLRGILYGLIVLPVTLILGGLLSGIGLIRTVWQSLPILLLSLLLAAGIWKKQETTIRLFTIFARFIRAVSVIGILAGLTEYLTGISFLPGVMPLRKALLDAGLCGILLIGSVPFAEILNRLLHRPLRMIGSRVGIRDKGITAMLLGIVSATATFGAMHDMEADEVTVDGAFLVSAAAVLGPHLSVCAANAPEMVGALICSRLIGGLVSAAFAVIMLRKKEHPAGA